MTNTSTTLDEFIELSKPSFEAAEKASKSIAVLDDGPFVDFKENYNSSNSVDRDFLQALQDGDDKEFHKCYLNG